MAVKQESPRDRALRLGTAEIQKQNKREDEARRRDSVSENTSEEEVSEGVPVAGIALAGLRTASQAPKVTRLDVWPVIVLVFVIGGATIIATGALPEGVFFALLLFLLLGALFPPVIIPVGFIVLIAIAYRGNVVGKIAAWVKTLTTAPAQPAQPLPPLGLAGSQNVPANNPVSGVGK